MDPGFVLLGTQGVPVILRELVLPGGFNLVSPSFTVREVATEPASNDHELVEARPPWTTWKHWTAVSSYCGTLYNPVLPQWILTTCPKLFEAILTYPIIQLSHNYPCIQCLYKTILDTFLSIDEVQLNNLFGEFSNQYSCIDYLFSEYVHNLNDRITLCIQKTDAYHLQLRNVSSFIFRLFSD
ncbi:unnamed protein product [Schistosoma margrebowiei]|uniref:Uncharacterized protein n=1 Tax=Schistosoma margrebowiei TaxID=48269 RepID=A0A183N2V1_9TREM|nr:unnamed protein product [Schistosoma margrebowiei]